MRDQAHADPRVALADIRRHVIGMRRAAERLPPSTAGPVSQQIVRLLFELDAFAERLDPGTIPPSTPRA